MARDRVTGDLFAVPMPAAPVPGSMDYRPTVAGLLSEMLDHAVSLGASRVAVAAEVSRLTGKDVSKFMLDAYTAPSKDDYNAPAWLMPVLEVACHSHGYSAWLAGIRGGRLMIGRDALAGELGRVEKQRDELGAVARELKAQMRRMG